MDPSRRIIIPLDVPTPEEALGIVRRLGGRVGLFKVGLQLFIAAGPGIVREIVEMGQRVFLDLKLHDIPNTVAAASREAARLGVSMVDVHLSGGARMVRAAREALDGVAQEGASRPLLLGITVLTSFDERDLESIGVRGPLADQVVDLALLGRDAGLDGVVASAHETAAIKKACGDRFIVVAPGIRPAGAETGDQRRVMTPEEAVTAGADYLVIGRPILEAPDPVAALERILKGAGG